MAKSCHTKHVAHWTILPAICFFVLVFRLFRSHLVRHRKHTMEWAHGQGTTVVVLLADAAATARNAAVAGSKHEPATYIPHTVHMPPPPPPPVLCAAGRAGLWILARSDVVGGGGVGLIILRK